MLSELERDVAGDGAIAVAFVVVVVLSWRARELEKVPLLPAFQGYNQFKILETR